MISVPFDQSPTFNWLFIIKVVWINIILSGKLLLIEENNGENGNCGLFGVIIFLNG